MESSGRVSTRKLICIFAASLLGCHMAYIGFFSVGGDQTESNTKSARELTASAYSAFVFSRDRENSKPERSSLPVEELPFAEGTLNTVLEEQPLSSQRGPPATPPPRPSKRKKRIEAWTNIEESEATPSPPIGTRQNNKAFVPSAPVEPVKPVKQQSKEGPEPEMWGVRFFYKPFIAPYPVFVDDQHRHDWKVATHGNGGRQWLDIDAKCEGFFPVGTRGTDELLICDPKQKDNGGSLTDVLLFKRGLQLPPQGCSNLRRMPFREITFDSAPDPHMFKSVGSDVIGYDSWSFQHFMEGPVNRVIQNMEWYKKYNSTLLAQFREAPGAPYHNPVVPKIWEKMGLKHKVKGWCGGYNTLQPCVHQFTPDITVACSWPKLYPDLAKKFRGLMGVSEDLPKPGRIVLFIRGGRATVQSHGGRNFVNAGQMHDACVRVAKEFGMGCKVESSFPMDSVDNIVKYFSDVRLLIGAHGGALWNFFFMPPGAGVIEISSDGYPTFWKHMAHYGSYYAPLKVRGANGVGLSADLAVDIGKLETLTRMMLKKTGLQPIKLAD